jgi:hypothetical protein
MGILIAVTFVGIKASPLMEVVMYPLQYVLYFCLAPQMAHGTSYVPSSN